ncbi:MAG: glycine cleavage system protein H [Gemmataceae bacterium]
MSDALTFHMGKFAAVLPADRLYARNHMWAQETAPGLFRFGFSTYAIRLMQDVYFLEWSVDAGDAVRQSQEIGHIETSKAESDLFAPLAGTLVRFNEALLNDPSGINVDGHGAGWLFEIAGGDPTPLMTVEGYHQFLSDNWEKTQRMIKGKINEDS